MKKIISLISLLLFFFVSIVAQNVQSSGDRMTTSLQSGDLSLPIANTLPNPAQPTDSVANAILYGYTIYNFTAGHGVINFDVSNPTVTTQISNYRDGINTVFVGEYVDEYLYLFTRDTASRPANFIKLSTTTWTAVSTTPTSEYATQMAYDYATYTMYAINGATLYTVDLSNGNLTRVATMERNYAAFAINLAGTLYGVDYSGDFYSIDKTTGNSTLIGATGKTDPFYIQTMGFDHYTGRLFWAFMSQSVYGELIEINTTTGAGTNLGMIGSYNELVAIYTPYHDIIPMAKTPTENAEDVPHNATVSVTFNQNITAGNLSAITITPDPGGVSASISGNTITIAHNDFDYFTNYTVTIPPAAITGLAGTVSWKFTTERNSALSYLSVSALPQTTMRPLAHAQFQLGANVALESAALTGAVPLSISVMPGTFSDTVLVTPSLTPGTNADYMANSLFTATTLGGCTAVYHINLPSDPDQSDNTAISTFEITRNTFANDNGNMANGVGGIEPITIGTQYELLVEDTVKSFTLQFSEVSAQPFKLAIYSLNGSMDRATPVYISGNTFTQPANVGVLTEYPIEPQLLPAGKYLFAVTQLGTTNITVAYDDAERSIFYEVSEDSILTGYTTFGNLFLRVNMGEFAEPNPKPVVTAQTPAPDADETALNAEVSVTFDIDITENDLSGITISPDPGGVSASIIGNKLMIAHDDFSQDAVRYTVTIPANSIANYDEEISWSFLSIEVGIDDNDKGNILIYPNPSDGMVKVIVPEKSLATIMDMTGKIIAIHHINTNDALTLNLASGLYLIQIQNNSGKSVHKIVIQ